MLPCKATGSPQPQITWIKDGIKIEGDDSKLISKDGSLIVLRMKGRDQGIYTCLAKSPVGTASATAKVYIGQGMLLVVFVYTIEDMCGEGVVYTIEDLHRGVVCTISDICGGGVVYTIEDLHGKGVVYTLEDVREGGIYHRRSTWREGVIYQIYVVPPIGKMIYLYAIYNMICKKYFPALF